MERTIWLTCIGPDGRVQLPRKVLYKLKWEGGDFIQIEVKGQGKVELRKLSDQGLVTYDGQKIVKSDD
ncbi:hypothetical protein [Neomoorella mulderi]|uniref:SpoVT-AbrB domain-containing protein n=1 Tax=Moorella mulderi DSM 14980 TaxID=1122241 RepID=A0A151AXG0_9FIRM|nr:hypothetical protein [Moorella mulderi]KYH32232.1 hypothetical protein MOMUL_14520 [Moorella mulderi DSM 14980]